MLAYLAKARWPDGSRCPGCGHAKGWELSTKAFTLECAGCGRQTSVTAGTVMHASKLPLTAWFWAAYLMATHSNGIAALQLQKQLGLGSYKSAWLLSAKLRRAMVAPDRSPLAGLVEIDERAIPHRKAEPPAGGHGRSPQGKMLVAALVEVDDGGPGRVRLAAIQTLRQSLHAFSRANVEAGATAKTDGWSGYPGAPASPTIRTSSASWPPNRPAVGAPRLRQPQTLGARRLPRSARQTPAIRPRRVCFRFNRRPPTRRLPLPARIVVARRPPPAKC